MVKITSKSATAASNGTPLISGTAKPLQGTTKPSKKVLKKKMEEKKLWYFWFSEWANSEYEGAKEEDAIYHEGKFEDCYDDKLVPAIRKGFVMMVDEEGQAWTSSNITNIIDCLEEEYGEQEVVIQFNPEKLISKMHCYLSRDEMERHYTALKECGWDVDDDWENGKRAVYRS